MSTKPPCFKQLLLILGVLMAAGCGTATAAASLSQQAGAQVTGPTAAGSEVTVDDPWVRATKGIADSSMTTVFGQFTNHTDRDLTIVAATNSLTGRTELHRMSMVGDTMVMGPLEGGIKILAHSTTTLDPNALHIMIMNLTTTIQPGDDVLVTATLDDGSSVAFHALGKDFAGGDESYTGGSSSGAMSGMDDMSPASSSS